MELPDELDFNEENREQASEFNFGARPEEMFQSNILVGSEANIKAIKIDAY